MVILDLKDYDPENNRGDRYILVIFENFSKFAWTIHLKNRNAQTIEDSFESILISSKRKPMSKEPDDGKEFVSKVFTDLLIKNNITDIVAILP